MRRAAVIIGLALLCGTIMNVTIAWGLAGWKTWVKISPIQPEANFIYLGPDAAWFVERRSLTGALAFHSTTMLPYDSPPSTEYRRESDKRTRFDVPSWVRARESDPGTFIHVNDIAWGWPFVSMRMRETPRSTWTHRWVVKIPSVGTAALPAEPIPAAFLVNSVVLGTPVLLAFLSRRMVRYLRRQCTDCGYPIGTSPVCTECGRAVGWRLFVRLRPRV